MKCNKRLKLYVILGVSLFVVSCSDEPKTFVDQYVKVCTRNGGGHTTKLCRCVGEYLDYGLRNHPQKIYLQSLIIKDSKNPELYPVVPLFTEAALSCYSHY